MRKIILFIFFCFSSLYAKTAYSLDELILLAISNSPDINISKTNLAISQKDYDQAVSAYLPKIDLGINSIYNDVKEAPIIGSANATLLTGSISLKQLLYDFGATTKSIASSKLITKEFDAYLKESIIVKKRDVKLAYYEILKNIALIDVAKENIKLNQAQVHRSKRYFEAGIRTKVDISDAKVALIQAEIALKNRNYALESSYAKLDRVVGFFTNKRDYKVVIPKLSTSSNLYTSLPIYPLKLQDAIKEAYKSKPKLQALLYQMQANKEEVISKEAAYYPKFYVEANYLKSQANKYEALLNQEQFMGGVYLNWNLFRGGSDKAKIEAQKLQTTKSALTLQQAKLQTKEEVTKAYIDLQRAKEDVRLSYELLKLSQEKFQQVSKQYEHGISDYIQLQEARQGYINAKNRVVVSYYNYFSAMAILDATIGR